MRRGRVCFPIFCAALLAAVFMIVGYQPAAADSSQVQKVTVKVGGRNVTKKTYQIEQGSSISIKTSVSPKSAAGSVSYRSSKKDVAAVNRNGKLTAKEVGTARITVSVTGKDKKKTTTWVRIKVVKKQAAEYEAYELSTHRDGNRIYGRIYVPQGIAGKMPAVIYSHGFGGDYETGQPYARALAQNGYVAYCFDFCGGGGDRSDGSALDMSIFTEQKDLEAVIDLIKQLSFVDQDNIFLLGASQGGVVSAITAAEHMDEIRGLMMLYPAFVLVDDAKEKFQSVDEIPDRYFHMWMTVGKTYFEKLLDYDVYEDIQAYEKDVLIIHGDADGIVPLSYSQKAIQEYRSAELKVIEGAGHGFYGREREDAVSYLLNYLESHKK